MELAGYKFFSNFDSGNLCRVEAIEVVDRQSHDVEFCMWTKPDCYGTEFQSNNTGTWFYFGMVGGKPEDRIRFNIMNLGRQSSLFSQGMRPVYIVPLENKGWTR